MRMTKKKLLKKPSNERRRKKRSKQWRLQRRLGTSALIWQIWIIFFCQLFTGHCWCQHKAEVGDWAWAESVYFAGPQVLPAFMNYPYIPALLRSDKYQASVKADFDEKKAQCEALFWNKFYLCLCFLYGSLDARPTAIFCRKLLMPTRPTWFDVILFHLSSLDLEACILWICFWEAHVGFARLKQHWCWLVRLLARTWRQRVSHWRRRKPKNPKTL